MSTAYNETEPASATGHNNGGPTAEEVNERIEELFGSAAAVPNAAAFACLSVEKTLGYELINRGFLRRVKIGRASRITVGSIKEVLLHGVPALPKPEMAEAITKRLGRPGR